MHRNDPSPSAQSIDVLLERSQLVRAVRGFSSLFWGLPISTMLYFHAMEVRILDRLQLPAYVAGMIVVFVGFFHLQRARFATTMWNDHARRGLLAAFLILYMSPLVYWYSALPPVGVHFVINFTGLVTCVIWLLLTVNTLVGELGVVASDPDLTIESRFCGWTVVVLMLAPITGMMAFAGYLSMKYESTFLSEMRTLREDTPIWAHIFFLVPLSLTMITTWKAKELCLELLQRAFSPEEET